jgi:hypothetical protein
VQEVRECYVEHEGPARGGEEIVRDEVRFDDPSSSSAFCGVIYRNLVAVTHARKGVKKTQGVERGGVEKIVGHVLTFFLVMGLCWSWSWRRHLID